MKFDTNWYLKKHKEDYKELIKFKRTYLRKSKRDKVLLYTRSSIASFSGDTMQTVAHTLVEWEVLESAKDVIYFYEKPWKWENEICLLYQIIENEDKDNFSEIVQEVIMLAVDSCTDSYYELLDVVHNRINDTKESISYYRSQLEKENV